MAELLRIREDAASTTGEDGRIVLSEGHISMGVGPLAPGLAAAVGALAAGGAEEARLVATVLEVEGEEALLKLHMLLRRLESAGWIERVLLDAAGDPVLTVRPLGHQLQSPPPPLPSAGSVVVSRFAALRAAGGELLAESPRGSLSLVVHQPALARLIATLSRPTPAAQLAVELGRGLGNLDVDVARGALALLGRARIVVPAGEEETGALALWNPADLTFHARSRVGANVGDYGGTYRLAGAVEPLPAVKPAGAPTVVLERPDLDALVADDIPFTRVLEQRRSVRAHDDERPITATQLGHFLSRSARVRAVFADDSQELSSRPYPGGGAIYELELYPLVHHCAGIAEGLYHYDPQAHTLGLVAEPGPGVSLLLGYGQRTAVMDAPPQVLILVAARFGRAMWKYESMAYALILKDVGVLYQTMYLVATAMDLAPCSLGGGNSDAFATTARLDPHAETSVGEFTLGSRGSEKPDAA